MKIAVSYENGNVFQHFGRTQEFKIYTAEDGKILSSELIGSNGAGHGALAGVLAEQAVDVLICGGLGGGAQQALSEAGIEVVAGAAGNTDEAVEAYLRGELVSTGVNCDHHDHHEEEEGGCSGGCGSCGGGCGSHEAPMEGPNVGKTCRVHYRGTFNDGTQFDSSYDRNEPLEFVCGAGMMIKGFDMAVKDMEVGQVIDVHLMPYEAYGDYDPNAVFSVPLAQLPGAENLKAGEKAYLQDMSGRPFVVKVLDINETDITFDANDDMAGKELNFRIELLSAE